MTGSPRCHHYQFAHAALRSVAFAHPLQLMALLASPEAKDAFGTLLEQVAENCKDCGELADFDAGQIVVHHRRAAGHPCAVVAMPEPRATGEAYYAAPVLLMRGGPDDVDLRYFTLEYSAAHDAEASTVLGEWQADGTHVNHGPGPEPSLEPFLAAVAARLRDAPRA